MDNHEELKDLIRYFFCVNDLITYNLYPRNSEETTDLMEYIFFGDENPRKKIISELFYNAFLLYKESSGDFNRREFHKYYLDNINTVNCRLKTIDVEKKIYLELPKY